MTVPSVCTANVKGKSYQYLQFSTKSLAEWNNLYALWYKDGKKVILLPPPKEGAMEDKILEKMLTPVSLAHWHMGDGGWTGKGIHLATNAFTKEDVLRLIAVLNKKFGLSCTWHNTNRIYIRLKSAIEFCKIVTPHFPPPKEGVAEEGMLYKVDKNIKKPILSSTPPIASDS